MGVEGFGKGLGGGGVGGGGLEGEDGWVGGVDVGGGDDVLETVPGRWLGRRGCLGGNRGRVGFSLLEDGAALLVVGPRHEDGLIPQAVWALEQLLKGRVGLDEVVCR